MACDNNSLDFGVQSPSINHQWMIAWGKSKRCLSLSSGVNRSSRLVVLRLARVRRSRGLRSDVFARDPGKLTLPGLTDTKCHALRGSTFSSAA